MPRRKSTKPPYRGEPGYMNPKVRIERSIHPMIRELFAEIKRQGLAMATLERTTGYARGSFAGWAHGRSGMKLASFVDIAQHLGYDVVLVRRPQTAIISDEIPLENLI